MIQLDLLAHLEEKIDVGGAHCGDVPYSLARCLIVRCAGSSSGPLPVGTLLACVPLRTCCIVVSVRSMAMGRQDAP